MDSVELGLVAIGLHRPDLEGRARAAIDRVAPPRCCALCNPHVGEVQRVYVRNAYWDWGWFWYCEEAIAEDRRRGFVVLTDAEYDEQYTPEDESESNA